jgi:carboxypeptidase C (cathepsin A)
MFAGIKTDNMKVMKRLFTLLWVCAAATGMSQAQKAVNPDTAVVTRHQTTIKGQVVAYTATTGMQPVWDDDGKAIAAVNYTYYERDGVKDKDTRPLVISFNGGPGSASAWMQLGYTGPSLLKIDSEGYPVMPYGTENNPYSILDMADIVYVNPVNTGYSRILNRETDGKQFFGVNEDIRYLATWISAFVNRINRWTSPKYLIGESYGTTRVSGLALELQSAHWMFLNGVVLVSPTGLGIRREGPVGEALSLPYMAATAWYHKALPEDLQQKDLLDLLPEVEKFAVEEYIPALAWGGSLPEDRRKAIAAGVARYSGISEKVILQRNLTLSTGFFWKELLRDKGFTVGRLDSRYKGIDVMDGGDRPEYNAEMQSWVHSFTPAVNHYMRNVLNYKTDLEYNMFGSVRPWNQEGNNTGRNLMSAVAQNPYLNVLLQSGYYDGACDYFNAKYNFWQMDKGGKFQNRFSFKGYRGGHMMYLRREDMQQANDDLREFFRNTIPREGEPAQYK